MGNDRVRGAPLPAAANGTRARTVPAPPVNVNRAGLGELLRVPGIGAAIARRLVAHREQDGPIRSVEQLRRLGCWSRHTRRAEPYLSFE